jgi:hypothetical protein
MAVDPCFLAFLRDVVDVWRPRATVGENGLLGGAAYQISAQALPCALQPTRASVVDALTGQVSAESHVAYLEPTDVAAGDLMVERRTSAQLTDAATAGSQFLPVDTTSVETGWAAVGEGENCELVLIETAASGQADLSAPLTMDHASGNVVWMLGCHEVVEVRDEAGVGHHLRVSLRQWGG